MHPPERAIPAGPVPAPAELRSFVGAATLAPSPDNNQPWLFDVRADGVLVCHDPARALPSDVDSMFSLIGLGAAVENLCVAARQGGWEPAVEFLGARPWAGESPFADTVALVRFRPGAGPDPLAPFLVGRATCRKPYRRRPVPGPALRALEKELAGFAELALHWTSDGASLRALAGLVAAADRVRFEYQPFHEELYRQLRFSREEAEGTRDGLDVRCLEIPPAAAAVLHWLRPWNRMRALNRLGLSRLLSIQSAWLTWRTGTIGLLTTAAPTREGYFRAGRGLERVWLKATELALAFHPLGSIPIFFARLFRQAGEGLTGNHRGALTRLVRPFYGLFPAARGRALVLLIRLGEAGPPVVRSLRRPEREVIRTGEIA
jgi:hypothetical protein